jgi:hypothetical protein
LQIRNRTTAKIREKAATLPVMPPTTAPVRLELGVEVADDEALAGAGAVAVAVVVVDEVCDEFPEVDVAVGRMIEEGPDFKHPSIL